MEIAMAKYQITETRLKNWIKAGRGQGFGTDYHPWIQITRQDFPSRGRSSIFVNPFNGRQHYLLSMIERAVLLQNLAHPMIIDIREQYPLWPWPHKSPLAELDEHNGIHDNDYERQSEGTSAVAKTIHFEHANFVGLDAPFIYTTDQLLTILRPDGSQGLVALAIKSWSELKNGGIPTGKGTLASRKKGRRNIFRKLRLERTYWQSIGVPWLLVTDRQLSPQVTQNLEWAISGKPRRIEEPHLADMNRLVWIWQQIPQGGTCQSQLKAAAKKLELSQEATTQLFKLALLRNLLPLDLTQPVHLQLPLSPCPVGTKTHIPSWSYLKRLDLGPIKPIQATKLGTPKQVHRNDVLCVQKNAASQLTGGLYRAVWVNRKSNSAYLLKFPLFIPNGEISTGNLRTKMRLKRPVYVELQLLESLIESRQISFSHAQLPKHFRREMTDLTEAEKRSLEKGKVVIRHLSTNLDFMRALEHRMLGRYVADIVKTLNKGRSESSPQATRDYVYQVLYRFWLFGCMQEALIGDTKNCGAKGKYRNPSPKKRGRPRKIVVLGHTPEKIGSNTSKEVRDLIWLSWEAYATKQKGYVGAYRKMVEVHYCDWEQDKNGFWHPIRREENIPSLETFRYYIKRRYERTELLRKLIPDHLWMKTNKALQGKEFHSLFGPTQRYMIDATVADVYLVSSFNPFWLIGRPIVYFVRDVWSGMIVGLHVALEGPSWDTARMAIYNAFSPKGEYLRAFGFRHLTDDDWPCAHACTSLIHDRGEVLSIPSTDSANELGLELIPCPPYAAEMKGSIETTFNWNNKETVHWLPGAVIARQKERGTRDYRLDAKLTLYQFTRILISGILTFNRTHDVSNRITGPLAGLKIDATPINLWSWGLENLHGSPLQYDKDQLYKTLLPQGLASIHADGVHFSGKTYSGSSLDQSLWRESARAFGVKKIKCRHDPNDPYQIHILNASTNLFETLRLLPGERVPEQSRWEELVDQAEFLKSEKFLTAEDKLVDRIAHRKFIDAEVKIAKQARKNSIPPVSKREHTNNIRENRKLEQEAQKTMNPHPTAAMPSKADQPTTAAINGHDVPEDLMALILGSSRLETDHA